MAYMNQEKKKVIVAALKKVVPSDWKYSLKVQHHSSICFTLRSAPVDVLAKAREVYPGQVKDDLQVNHYYMDRVFEGDILKTFEDIKDALNSADNYNNSDAMTDYFDVGYYYHIHIGQWNKPFVVAPLAH